MEAATRSAALATRPPSVRHALQGGLTWLLCWAAMGLLDRHVDLAGLAVLQLLAAAVAALWLPLAASLVSSTLAVLAFNWFFVPPRGALGVDLRQHALLLIGMLLVSWIVSALMAAQRRLAEQLAQQAREATQLREWGNALRAVASPQDQAGQLCSLLAGLRPGNVPVLMLLRDTLPALDDPAAVTLHGAAPPDADERVGLWLCLRGSRAMGPGTGAHEELHCWYLPLRGRQASFGAVALRLALPITPDDETLRLHAQALCDQMGTTLQQAQSAAHAEQARQQAQTQSVRNAMLAAISHDYRTPLATLLGAASSLRDQGERLSPAQRQRLADTLVSEITQLARLTDNTLQLARLEAPGVQLQLDWESAEDIVGAAMRRATQRQQAQALHPGPAAGGSQAPRASRLRARVEPGLPLLRCDALLMAQLLDNLIDNALKATPEPDSGEPAPAVELLARAQGGSVVLAVRDRGPGVPSGWQERIFEVFQRGPAATPASPVQARTQSRPGAGVGLAVCRAIARAHGGELRLRPRGHGGSSFECWLPIPPAPLATEP